MDHLRLFFILVLLLLMQCADYSSGMAINRRVVYSRDFLLQLRLHASQAPGVGTLPGEILVPRSNYAPDTNKKKKTRRGRKKKSRVRARLKRERGKHQPLPSVILANVRSIRNKTDELQANVTYMYEYRTAAILAFMETWLSSNDSDGSLYVDGFGTPTRLDRDSQLTGKKHGSGVCLYVNKRWCSSVTVRERLCTADIELLAVSLRPFYLPREFPQLFFILVYIHPKAKSSAASEHIMSTLNRFELISPDSPKFVLGDFNHCSADNFLKGFYQYVTCSTRMGKTLDKCYGTVPNAY